MPKSSEVTYTCDRCGTASSAITGPPPNAPLTPPPKGWNTVQSVVSPAPNSAAQLATLYLCSTCAAAFNDFMAKKPT